MVLLHLYSISCQWKHVRFSATLADGPVVVFREATSSWNGVLTLPSSTLNVTTGRVL